jgi:catechol 2,3-dioxygenase-like lactoylglutathione lyase family enzyme
LALDEKVVRSLAVRLEAVAFDVADAHAAAAFWAGLLDREVVTEPGAALVPGDPTQVGLRFVTSERRRAGRPRLHLHVTSRSLDDQQRIVAAALRLGGRPHEVGQTGEEGFVVLADPEGNELCVIEPGNTYLAGTGDLGEVTCEGTRAVGLFWRAALRWLLVWDEGEQTAIQSPSGGTKISWDSWDGSPAEPQEPRNGQRFDLLSTDLAVDRERLLSLGATFVRPLAAGVQLLDPDGSPFTLRLDHKTD